MYGFMIVGGIVIGILSIIMFILQGIDSCSGEVLQNEFAKLGKLQGKTYNTIVNAVGYPNSITQMQNGRYLAQWIATGYHIALLFNRFDVCMGISSETVV